MILDRSSYGLGDVPAQPDYTAVASTLPASASALLPSFSPYANAVVAQMQADGFQVSNLSWVSPLVFMGTLSATGGASYNFSLQLSDLQNLSATRKARSLEQFLTGTSAPVGFTIPRSKYADWFSNEAPTPVVNGAVLASPPVPMPPVYAPSQGTTVPVATSGVDTSALVPAATTGTILGMSQNTFLLLAGAAVVAYLLFAGKGGKS